jgi:hypothetical protein
MAVLTQERLKEVLHYDPATGVFTHIRACCANRKRGAIAGSYDQNGYRKTIIDGKTHSVHRLAWLYMFGSFPTQEIDHINRVRDDNRIANLRDVPRTVNQNNKGPIATPQRGAVPRRQPREVSIGAYENGKTGKWRSQITRNKKYVYLGVFQTQAEATAAFLEARAAFDDEVAA